MGSKNVVDLRCLNIMFWSNEENMVYYWRKKFDGIRRISIVEDDVFERKGDVVVHKKADAIVSFGNSYGVMGAGMGIDDLICNNFGDEIEFKLEKIIENNHSGELVIGEAVVIPTHDDYIPFFISAPIMKTPGVLDKSFNPYFAYLAIRAVFIAIKKHNQNCEKQIDSVIIPDMGFSTKKFCKIIAEQTIEAYASVVYGKNSFQKVKKNIRSTVSIARRDHGVFE